MAAHGPLVPGYGGYAAAKASMVSLTKSINVEAGRHGIRATALCPTYVDTPLWDGSTVARDSMLPADAIAHSVVFLCQLPPGVLIEVLDLAVAPRAPQDDSAG
jgi:NAD(P)-dependent dehydrogenase (short-subunit alcohol dehydrogenase family)